MTPLEFCEACGRKASPGARFCGGCGRDLQAAASPAERDDPDAAPEGRAPARPKDGPPAEATEFELRPVAVQSFGQLLLCVLTVGIAWIVLVLMRRGVRYRITSQRIEIVTGIVTVTRRTVDLFRVQDLEIVEPLFLRMGGKGHITVRSQDAGEPVVVLRAIPDVHRVHESLRALVATERQRQHVRVVEDAR